MVVNFLVLYLLPFCICYAIWNIPILRSLGIFYGHCGILYRICMLLQKNLATLDPNNYGPITTFSWTSH
jgi:hypothetical protein